MKSITNRLFSRKVLGLAAQAQRASKQVDPAARDWYEVQVPSAYEERMSKFQKDYTKLYRFDITAPKNSKEPVPNKKETGITTKEQALKDREAQLPLQKDGEEFVDQRTNPAYLGV